MTKEELFSAIDLAIRTNVVTYEEIVTRVHPNGTVQTEHHRRSLAEALMQQHAATITKKR